MVKGSVTHTLSIVVPVYKEAAGLVRFHDSLVASLAGLRGITSEIIYCDDGSTDGSAEVIRSLHSSNKAVKLVALSRNFGKEYALTAGIAEAQGDAILMIDGDGQHPVGLIPRFVEAWQAGAQVVVGVRKESESVSWFARLCSQLFYALFNKVSGERLVARATDFRLITREVADAFLSLNENDRITRGLIDWLGFERSYIEFTAGKRVHGRATYSFKKLVQLALNSFISLSNVPLFLFGYLGVVITLLSGILGLLVLIEQIIMRDPLAWRFTGTAMLGILILFLIGIVLMSQGILALYISHIHSQSKRRPLYVINRSRSIGLKD